MYGSIFDEYLDHFVARYRVRMEFPPGSWLIGASPVSRERIQRWFYARLAGREQAMGARVAEELARRNITSPEQLTHEVIDQIAADLAMETTGTVHQRDIDGNLIVFHGRLKAMLKEAISIAFPYQAGARAGLVEGQRRSPLQFLAEAVRVWPDRVPIQRQLPDGRVVTLRDEDVCLGTQPGVVSTPQGQRSIVSQFEYVEDVFLEFYLHVQNDAIPHDWWPYIWLAAMQNGFGAKRSLGHGLFRVTVFERLNEPDYLRTALGPGVPPARAAGDGSRPRGRRKARATEEPDAA